MASYIRARIEVQEKNGIWQLVKWPEVYNPSNYGPGLKWKLKVFFGRLLAIRKTKKLYEGMKIKKPLLNTIKDLWKFGGERRKPKTYKIEGTKYYLETDIEIPSFRKYVDIMNGNSGVPSDASFELQVLVDDDSRDEYTRYSYKWITLCDIENLIDSRVDKINKMIDKIGLNKKIDKIIEKLNIEKEEEDEFIAGFEEYVDDDTIDEYIWEVRRMLEFAGMVKQVVELSNADYFIDEKIRIIYTVC